MKTMSLACPFATAPPFAKPAPALAGTWEGSRNSRLAVAIRAAALTRFKLDGQPARTVALRRRRGV